MKEITTKIYDINDMKAHENMSGKKAASILRNAYRGYINRYHFPDFERDKFTEFSETEEYEYEIQCAFEKAYKVLESIDD